MSCFPLNDLLVEFKILTMRHRTMKYTKLIGLATLLILLPTTAMANDIKVKAGNVEVNTYQDGSVYVNTGRTTARVEPRRFSRYWNPFRYWRLPWQSNCRHSSYQSTTQSTSSGGKVIQSRVSSHSCH